MEIIIFYTELDKIIGCTQDKSIKGEPFCDECLEQSRSCFYRNKYTEDIQQQFQKEHQLKASFIKL
jgi:hypothetical protein